MWLKNLTSTKASFKSLKHSMREELMDNKMETFFHILTEQWESIKGAQLTCTFQHLSEKQLLKNPSGNHASISISVRPIWNMFCRPHQHNDSQIACWIETSTDKSKVMVNGIGNDNVKSYMNGTQLQEVQLSKPPFPNMAAAQQIYVSGSQ